MWRRWRLWFSLFIASHESGQQQLEIQQIQRANVTTLAHHWSCWIAMEVIVGGSIDITFATVKLRIYTCVPSTLSLYLIRDRMQMNWLKYSYSMHFFLLSLILFQVLVFFFFFFFPSYLFIPRECCKRKKEKKKYHLILPHSFPHKKCYAHCAILRVAKTTFSRVISFFPFFFPLPPVFVQDRINVELMQILQLRDTIAWRASSSSSSWFFWF